MKTLFEASYFTQEQLIHSKPHICYKKELEELYSLNLEVFTFNLQYRI